MKKYLVLVFALFASILVLTGCSSDEESTDTSVDMESLEGTTVTIGVWKGNSGEEAALDEMIAAFEEDTGIIVEKHVYTDINTELPAELMAGTAPDAFYIDSSLVPTLIEDGALEPLTPYLTEDDMADFYPALVEPFTDSEGTVYALPKDFSTIGLYVNEDLLAEAGYTIEDIPTAYEDMPAFISELQTKLPEGTYAFSTVMGIDRWFSYLQVGGASIIAEDGTVQLSDPAVVANAEMMTTLLNTPGYIEPTAAGFGWAGDMFGAQKCVMTLEGAWLEPMLIKDFPDVNYTVLPAPTYKGEQTTPAYTVGWGVNSNAENKEGAIAWTLYATNEGMAIWCEGAEALPSRASISDELGIAEDETSSVFASQVEYATVWQLGAHTVNIMNEFNNQWPLVVDGTLTIEQAFAKVDEVVNADAETFE